MKKYALLGAFLFLATIISINVASAQFMPDITEQVFNEDVRINGTVFIGDVNTANYFEAKSNQRLFFGSPEVEFGSQTQVFFARSTNQLVFDSDSSTPLYLNGDCYSENCQVDLPHEPSQIATTDLDETITGTKTFNALAKFNNLFNFGPKTQQINSSGGIVYDAPMIVLEHSESSMNLSYIQGCTPGNFLILQTASNSNDVNVVNTGNIDTTRTLNQVKDKLMLVCDAVNVNKWSELRPT